MKPVRHPPAGSVAYAVLAGVSSILTASGYHRIFYSALHGAQIPEPGISALTGLANLSWHEVAFVVAGAAKSAFLFTLLPVVGSATGFLSGILQLSRSRWRGPVVFAHLLFATLLGIAALAVVGIRWWRGFPDSWRGVTSLAFCIGSIFWLLYFWRSRGPLQNRLFPAKEGT